MILNKYNEIMERVTIDPEMKSRVMSAVSTAIKEQAEGAAIVTELHSNENSEYTKTRTGKKAKKTPIVVISSIAAAIVVLLGALFIFNLMSSKGASTTQDEAKHLGIDSADIANATEAVEEMEETTSQKSVFYYIETPVPEAGLDGADTAGAPNAGSGTYDDSVEDPNTDLRTVTVDINTDGVVDDRVTNIGSALPFDLKGNGKGKLADGIVTEVFLGEGGEKVVLYTADEGADLVKDFDSSNKSTGQDAVSPLGTQVKLFKLAFGNVITPANGETATEFNAALFTKNGHTYLLVFSDVQSTDVILGVVDAV
ncbi:hypothetical protein SAMN02910264_01981 [Ruminococcaceae bacterium YAD3003]|nr:hypothetical protein SAMN02910264_01981 [Ruminococcaceae bacterium YAD3003]